MNSSYVVYCAMDERFMNINRYDNSINNVYCFGDYIKAVITTTTSTGKRYDTYTIVFSNVESAIKKLKSSFTNLHASNFVLVPIVEDELDFVESYLVRDLI